MKPDFHRLKPLLLRNLFKILMPAAGLACGLGLFGIAFGLVAGILLDQLRVRKKTETSYSRNREPAKEDREGPKPDDFDILGLKPGCSREEAKKVYRKLAAQFHPDGTGGLSEEQKAAAEAAFIKIKEAYGRVIKSLGG